MEMDVLKNRSNSQLWRFGWQFLFPWLFLAAIIVCIAGALVSTMSGFEPLMQALFALGLILFAAALLSAFFGLLVMSYEMVRSVKENGEKMDNIVEMLNRNRRLLAQVAQGIRLSDAAKEIAFRDTDRMELREAIMGKLHQHDFASTFAMIDDMSRRLEYSKLAEELRVKAEKYKESTEDARIRQAISHIEELFEQRRWAVASGQIEDLIRTFPESNAVKALPQRLQEMKDRRKRDLLAAWDNAVKRQDVDLSLEILKELDLYLTPTEGLALQESASNVYKTKLHNLGVQFSLAVTENQWQVAVETGKQIIREFPNSRMAHEIRGKMDILTLNANKHKD